MPLRERFATEVLPGAFRAYSSRFVGRSRGSRVGRSALYMETAGGKQAHPKFALYPVGVPWRNDGITALE